MPPELPNGTLSAVSLTFDPDTQQHFYRLLGYPTGHQPEGRAKEGIEAALHWYQHHGDPEAHTHLAGIESIDRDQVQLEAGFTLRSSVLANRLQRLEASSLVVAGMTAGARVDQKTAEHFEQGRPDAGWALDRVAAATVRQLTRYLQAALCQHFEADGLSVAQHYSPGYVGWDLADQHVLFELLAQKSTQEGVSSVGSLKLKGSTMLLPKSSMLGVYAVAPRDRVPEGTGAAASVPCSQCAQRPCEYRRAPYQPNR